MARASVSPGTRMAHTTCSLAQLIESMNPGARIIEKKEAHAKGTQARKPASRGPQPYELKTASPMSVSKPAMKPIVTMNDMNMHARSVTLETRAFSTSASVVGAVSGCGGTHRRRMGA
jgi:hypothetical protein